LYVCELRFSRCERDGLPVPAKRFRWTERLRSSLKQLVTVLFFNLEMQCTSVGDIYPTVVQYLFGNILPSFKGRISFEFVFGVFFSFLFFFIEIGTSEWEIIHHDWFHYLSLIIRYI
uniref:Ion_trans domain-containing protein n=1 Tax=Ascaris lumbricoides TaxID=6252 RepID=A0A0M3HJI4_ASCLU